MREPEQVSYLIADARELYADALDQAAAGKLRNAAEKAWGATKRATDALLVARFGREPGASGQTYQELSRRRHSDPALVPLGQTYRYRQRFLHGKCFYRGEWDSADAVLYHIHATLDYIQEVARLAGE